MAAPESSIGEQSKFAYIKANNGHLNIVSEAITGSFAGEIKTVEDVRAFVDDLESDIEKRLRSSKDSKGEAREIAASLVGQVLGLSKDHPRSYFWLGALREAPQGTAVKETYNTFASIRTR